MCDQRSEKEEADSYVIRRFLLPMDQIGYVRFIVEGYEGLAQVSASAGQAEICWGIPRSRLSEANDLIEALAGEAGLGELLD
jgi:hypothetical protein